MENPAAAWPPSLAEEGQSKGLCHWLGLDQQKS